MNPDISHFERWEDDLRERYPEEKTRENPKKREDFRDYEGAKDGVKEFYRLNHRNQTFDFVREKEKEYSTLDRRRMGIWEAMEFLNELVDESDPDTELSQIQHLLQTSEAIRGDGKPDWFILAGLIHDLGKILCLYGEPQWAVVGDTFPVGCAFSDRIVYPEYFEENPDTHHPTYSTRLGVYDEGAGLDRVHLSWGHDEYLYRVVRDYLPEEALYMIRYHSFYPGHREGAYDYLMNDHDREMFGWVRAFNPYDLYSKSDRPPDVQELKPYYMDLIGRYFPEKIDW
ncbi:MAG: inositol oxygenase [Candidatus Omnitrophica bacterium]|nr:inositol oxygenase [Candidatus Omnitrophota bacterium]